MTGTRLTSRTIVRIAPEEGENAAEFLQGLVTNDVTGVLPVWCGLLTPQGKALFDFIVWPGGNDYLLDCEAEWADALVKRLLLYRLRRKIAITRDDTIAVHWRPHIGDGAAPDPRLTALGERWLSPVAPDDTGMVADDETADTAWLAHRLHHGVPEGRAELGDGETLWLECNAVELKGVSFTKGCYVGQENTARMNWRQKINRRLLVVPLDRSNPERRRVAYPELGKAVDLLRLGEVPADLMPAWLRETAAT